MVRHVTDEAELWVADLGADQATIDAADADGVVAVHVDGGDQLWVDLALQHHAGDLDRFAVGHP